MASGLNRRTLLRWGGLGIVSTAAPQSAHAIEPIVRNGASAMRVSCAAYSYRQFLTGSQPSMTLENFIDRCAEMGCDAVELTSYYFPAEVTEEYVMGLKRRSFLLGLDISSTAVGNNFCHPAGEQRQKEIAHVKRWTDIAQKLGAPVIRIFAGPAPKDVGEDQARSWCLECIEECCDYAGKSGIFLAIENHGGIVATADQLLTLVKAARSPWLAVNLDTGNFRTEDPYGDLQRCAPYAVTVQVKTEVTPRGREKQEADLGRIVQIMRDVKYRGYLVLEYEAAEDPRIAVPGYVRNLKATLG